MTATTSTMGIKTVLHPVSDLAAAKAMYTALLGVEPEADAPYYVGYDVEGQHIGLVPGGDRWHDRRSPTGTCPTSRPSWPK